MASIADLLKYKKEVELKNSRGEVVQKVWVKLLGDESIQTAYKFARVKSSQMRKSLLDETSLDHVEHIDSLEDQTNEDLYNYIVASKTNDFTRESIAIIAREELPKIEEIAVEPDAPSLHEQEQLDEKEEILEKDYSTRINKYVEERKVAFENTLKINNRKKLLELASEEMVNTVPQQTFIGELNEQKCFRGTYFDKECKNRAFATIEEFKDADRSIKEQLLAAYDSLELGADEVKN